MIRAALDRGRARCAGDDAAAGAIGSRRLRSMLMMQFLIAPTRSSTTWPRRTSSTVVDAARAAGDEAFGARSQACASSARRSACRVAEQVLSQVMLAVLDEKWKDHLYDLDQLRNAIQYRAYGQRDPLVEYKKEAFEMFEDLLRDIQVTFAERFLKIQVTADAPPPPPPVPVPTVTSGPSTDDLFSGPPTRTVGAAPPRLATTAGALGAAAAPVAEVGRNDPCPCGSGKKYKKCHGAGV